MRIENKFIKMEVIGRDPELIFDAVVDDRGDEPITIISGHLADKLRWRVTKDETPQIGSVIITPTSDGLTMCWRVMQTQHVKLMLNNTRGAVASIDDFSHWRPLIEGIDTPIESAR